MKNTFFVILLNLLMLFATACYSNTPHISTDSDSNSQITSSTKTTEPIIQTEVSSITTTPHEDDGLITIQTDHFSIKIPQEWKNTCTYEIGDMWISFTHKKSADFGGRLFTISLEDTSYYSYAESEILGGLGIPNLGEFNVWVRYPSDIQFDMDNPDEYLKCSNEIENILSTISFNDGYYFSKTPYEIEKEDAPDYPTYEDTTTPSTDTSTNTLSDSTIAYKANIYLQQIASDIKYEYRNNGYKMCNASPQIAYTSVTNRTNDMVLVQGKIALWLDGGGDPDGNLTVTLMINPYNGNLIDWYSK